ncbi:MAG: hypothetical protein OPY06_01710 [Nitrosopumilus sp.]|nr:hypothetical protein [Nitrosopumilus sp.]MDF2423255.1 hypothetical protein [Nitrosopumilus sp.]MDF2424197.1 hypothetical protein [Nitrosopumilus sp.]MDF2425073.1 hypothetical protein [Nitrosopumilus sp.]MDF2426317.1 hypothetical protein [Nitrosopumilus sp.]
MDLEKFRNDIFEMIGKLSKNLREDDVSKLNYVGQQLIGLYRKNLVKINHSVLELICASTLISRGYAVEVEKDVSEILVCDIYAKKGGGNTIIEIETGFTPPEHAMDTIDYFSARIMSKIARYSQHCSKFSLATPVVGILPISKIFLLPPNARKREDVQKIKDLCDRYYKNPPIKYDDILNAHLHSIYLINIDKGFAKELDPQGYVDLTNSLLERSEVEY